MTQKTKLNKSRLMYKTMALVVLGVTLMSFVPSIGACPFSKPKTDAKTAVGQVTNEISGVVSSIGDNGGVVLYAAWGCEDSIDMETCYACCAWAGQTVYNSCMQGQPNPPPQNMVDLCTKQMNAAMDACTKDCCIYSQPVPPKAKAVE